MEAYVSQFILSKYYLEVICNIHGRIPFFSIHEHLRLLRRRIFAVCSTVTYSGYVCTIRSRSTLVTPFYVVTVGDIVGMLDHKINEILFAHKVAPAEDVSR